jgi:hypothetical protein
MRMPRATPSKEPASTTAFDRALSRILSELQEGVRHGYFEFAITCEVTSGDRRRLTLRAGKSHQFVIPKEECVRSAAPTPDSCDGSDPHVD